MFTAHVGQAVLILVSFFDFVYSKVAEYRITDFMG